MERVNFQDGHFSTFTEKFTIQPKFECHSLTYKRDTELMHLFGLYKAQVMFLFTI